MKKVTLAEAPALPQTQPDLKGASVQELISHRTVGSQRGSLFITTFTPGGNHVLHRHTTSGQISYLLHGVGEHLTENGPVPLSAGDVTFARKGEWHGFRNVGDEPAVLVSLYSPAGDLASTGYETYKGEVQASGTPHVSKASLSDLQGDAALDEGAGFVGLGVFWLATRDTLGTDGFLLGASTFEPGGVHEFHRHPNGDEILFILEGGGEHLTLDEAIPLSAGEIAYIPANEYHGFRNAEGVLTKTLFGYFGPATLDEAGYEVWEAVKP